MNPSRQSRRLALLLAMSFTLTVASFLVSRLVSEHRAHGIEDAAVKINEHAVPAFDSLGRVRTELRRKGMLLDVLARGDVSREDAHVMRSDLQQARSRMEQSWAEYTALAVFPGEQELIATTEAHKRELDASVDRVLQRIGQGDYSSARWEINSRTKHALAVTDDDVHEAGVLNRRVTRQATDTITELRRASRRWGIALDAVCVLLSIVSAYFVIRVLRRYMALSDVRLVEMEHFAGRVAHDIRSPLSAVMLVLDLVKRRAEADPETQSIVDRGFRTVQRIRQLVDGLLIFATAGKPCADEDRAKVAEVLDGVVEDIRHVAAEKDIRIDCELPRAELVAACSPGVLVSILSNLLGNAVKYMGDATVRDVTVRVSEVGRTVRVEVEDTGPGIPAALRPRIFDPHIRGADSAVSGFGLGLATVRRLVEAHGGAVGLQATERVGSLFWFELPKSVVPERRAPSGGPGQARVSTPTPTPTPT